MYGYEREGTGLWRGIGRKKNGNVCLGLGLGVKI
jgi:hypothetical protein